MEQAFETRLFCYVPAAGVFILESRPFWQPGLTQSSTLSRIGGLLGQSIGVQAALVPFKCDVGKEGFVSRFLEREVSSLTVSQLLRRKVPIDFKFFNPDYDKNQVARELFDEYILPFTDSLTLSADKKSSVDLRKNKLALLSLEIGRPEELTTGPKGQRETMKRSYDQRLQVDVASSDPVGAATELIKGLSEQVPLDLIRVTISTSVQPTLFDQPDGDNPDV